MTTPEKRYKATLEAIGSGIKKTADIALSIGLRPSTITHYIIKAKEEGHLIVHENRDKAKGYTYELTQHGKDYVGRRNYSPVKVMQALDKYVMEAYHYARRPRTLTAIHDNFMRGCR